MIYLFYEEVSTLFFHFPIPFENLPLSFLAALLNDPSTLARGSVTQRRRIPSTHYPVQYLCAAFMLNKQYCLRTHMYNNLIIFVYAV